MSNFDATMETSLLKQSSEAQCSLQGVRTYPFTSHRHRVATDYLPFMGAVFSNSRSEKGFLCKIFF